jgi:uncharacterized membrane protein
MFNHLETDSLKPKRLLAVVKFLPQRRLAIITIPKKFAVVKLPWLLGSVVAQPWETLP